MVVEKLQSPGEMATTNINQPILKLARVNPLHVEVVLPVSEFGKIKPGMKGQVVPEKPIPGTFSALVKVVVTAWWTRRAAPSACAWSCRIPLRPSPPG